MMKVGTDTIVSGWKIDSDDEQVSLIRDMVFESIKDPLVIWVARKIVADCPSRDWECELNAIYYTVKEGEIPIPVDGGKQVVYVPSLRFVDDVKNIDTYPTAGKIIRWMAQGANGEDCDGHTILVASLLMAIGFLTGCAIVSKDGVTYSHIFPLAGVPKNNPQGWMALDTTVKEAFPGWLPPRGSMSKYNVRKMKIYAFTDEKVLKGRRLF